VRRRDSDHVRAAPAAESSSAQGNAANQLCQTLSQEARGREVYRKLATGPAGEKTAHAGEQKEQGLPNSSGE